jgi:small-conductance mechanosensitive channel
MSHFGRQPEHVAALSPLRWNVVKLEQDWSSTAAALKTNEQARRSSLLAKHNEQQRQLTQQLSKLRTQTLAKSPLNVRLRKMRSTVDSLQRRGRPAAAEALLKRLKPLEEGYNRIQLREAGYTGEALRLQEVRCMIQQ